MFAARIAVQVVRSPVRSLTNSGPDPTAEPPDQPAAGGALVEEQAVERPVDEPAGHDCGPAGRLQLGRAGDRQPEDRQVRDVERLRVDTVDGLQAAGLEEPPPVGIVRRALRRHRGEQPLDLRVGIRRPVARAPSRARSAPAPRAGRGRRRVRARSGCRRRPSAPAAPSISSSPRARADTPRRGPGPRPASARPRRRRRRRPG